MPATLTITPWPDPLLDTQGVGTCPGRREEPDATTVVGRALMCRYGASDGGRRVTFGARVRCASPRLSLLVPAPLDTCPAARLFPRADRVAS
jgi:hypothetical protein